MSSLAVAVLEALLEHAGAAPRSGRRGTGDRRSSRRAARRRRGRSPTWVPSHAEYRKPVRAFTPSQSHGRRLPRPAGAHARLRAPTQPRLRDTAAARDTRRHAARPPQLAGSRSACSSRRARRGVQRRGRPRPRPPNAVLPGRGTTTSRSSSREHDEAATKHVEQQLAMVEKMAEHAPEDDQQGRRRRSSTRCGSVRADDTSVAKDRRSRLETRDRRQRQPLRRSTAAASTSRTAARASEPHRGVEASAAAAVGGACAPTASLLRRFERCRPSSTNSTADATPAGVSPTPRSVSVSAQRRAAAASELRRTRPTARRRRCARRGRRRTPCTSSASFSGRHAGAEHLEHRRLDDAVEDLLLAAVVDGLDLDLARGATRRARRGR